MRPAGESRHLCRVLRFHLLTLTVSQSVTVSQGQRNHNDHAILPCQMLTQIDLYEVFTWLFSFESEYHGEQGHGT